jgi:hypothetical protein
MEEYRWALPDQNRKRENAAAARYILSGKIRRAPERCDMISIHGGLRLKSREELEAGNLALRH